MRVLVSTSASYPSTLSRSSNACTKETCAPRLPWASQMCPMVGKSNSPNTTLRRFVKVSALATELTPAEALATSATSSRSEEHTSELQSRGHLVCRLLLEKKNR